MKNISQNGDLPQIGMNIKNIWVATTQTTLFSPTTNWQSRPYVKPPFTPFGCWQTWEKKPTWDPKGLYYNANYQLYPTSCRAAVGNCSKAPFWDKIYVTSLKFRGTAHAVSVDRKSSDQVYQDYWLRVDPLQPELCLSPLGDQTSDHLHPRELWQRLETCRRMIQASDFLQDLHHEKRATEPVTIPNTQQWKY